jgi:hypothetical protein
MSSSRGGSTCTDIRFVGFPDDRLISLAIPLRFRLDVDRERWRRRSLATVPFLYVVLVAQIMRRGGTDQVCGVRLRARRPSDVEGLGRQPWRRRLMVPRETCDSLACWRDLQNDAAVAFGHDRAKWLLDMLSAGTPRCWPDATLG